MNEKRGSKRSHEKRIREIPRKENLRILLDMGRDTNAGRVVCGRTADKEVPEPARICRGIAAEVPEPARICRGIAAEVLEPARICRGTIGSGKKISNFQEPAQVKAA